MARARNIKPGFYKNEELAECSIWARFIFPGLWMLADREGRLEDRPKRIKGELLPFDSAEVEPLLAELSARGFIHRYSVKGVAYIQVLKFAEHQSPHYSEKESLIPAPFPESGADDAIDIPESSGKVVAIKRGSQPSDSLIPDSLIPDSPLPPTFQLGDPSATTKKSRAKPSVTLRTYCADCEKSGQDPIPEGHHVFAYAESIGLPRDFLDLAWTAFCDRYLPGDKRQSDWPLKFRNAVEGNWFSLWWVDGSEYKLTTAGMQAKRARASKEVAYG